MKTIVIIASTRHVARKRLWQIAGGNGIEDHKDYYEAVLDGHRFIALGGSPLDVCWLVRLGFGLEIITVGDGISPEMQRRINHVCSANGRVRK